MGVLSITTEDVLSRVSDEVQGFFFEELEKIASRVQDVAMPVFGLLSQAQRKARKNPRAAVRVRRPRSSSLPPPLPAGTPPPLPAGTPPPLSVGTPPPLPVKPRDPTKPLPGMVDAPSSKPDPDDFSASAVTPEEKVQPPPSVVGPAPVDNRMLNLVGKNAREDYLRDPSPQNREALKEIIETRAPNLSAAFGTDDLEQATDKYIDNLRRSQPAASTAPGPARSRSRQDVTYEAPSWLSKATAGPEDVTDADIRAYAQDVVLQRASVQTPKGLQFQQNNGPRIEAALREMKQRAASRVQAPAGITGRPAKPMTMDELRQETARQQRERAAAGASTPAWLEALRKGTSNIGDAEVDSFLAQHGTDFSALTGDAKKFYQANKGLIDDRARRMPPKTPKPTTTEAESAAGKTYTDEEKREIAKQVSRDALARQEAQEKALNNAVEDLDKEGLKLDTPKFMPRLKKLLQPTGKIEFGTQRSEGELIEFLGGYREKNRQKALKAILRRNPAQYLNIGDEAREILGMSSEKLIENQRRFVDENPQMILGINKKMADKLGIDNYSRLRTAALAKATLEYGDQAAEAAGRDALEAGARAARSGVDRVKDVASRAAQTARDTAARVRAAPGAAAGAAAGAAKRVVEGAPAALEQAADAAGRAAGAAGRVAGAAGKLESDVAASYMGGLLGLDKDKLKGLSFVRSRATRANEINERINQIMKEGGGKGINDPKASVFGLSQKRVDELNDELSTLRAEKNRLIKEVADADFVDDRITSRFRESFKGDIYNPNARGFTDSVSGDGGVEMFGGTPADPKIMDTLRSIIGGIIPPESATREAADAASGLGKALSEINPAYLAAAAGATGVVGGLALTSTSPSPQNQQYGY